MKVQGKVIKINAELGYGFVLCGKSQEVFFSAQTGFHGTSFDALKVNDVVAVEVTETDRGPFAKELEAARSKPAHRAPDLTL